HSFDRHHRRRTAHADRRLDPRRRMDARGGVLMMRAITILLVASSLAHAQPMDTYGMGSRSVAMGGAVTADVEDFSANYYNPAGIVRSHKLRIGAGWFGAFHDLYLDDQNSGVDPVHGAVVGFNVPGNIGDFRFAFGLGVHLNDQRISRT